MFLKKIIGNEPLPLECLIAKAGMGKHEEGDPDELWKLLLNSNINDPAGNCFIQ